LRQAYDYWQDQPGNYGAKRQDASPSRAVSRFETSTQCAEAQGVIKFANLSVMLKSKYTEVLAVSKPRERIMPKGSHG